MVLSTAYFPPISYISLLRRGDVALEGCENYQKQSWRNRACILTAGGVEPLQVPVVHEGGTFRHPIREIRVDWSKDWMIRHQRALDSAYNSSAYFEHYRDELYRVMDRRPDTLWELNCSLLEFVLDRLGMSMPAVTEDFCGEYADIHPKHPDAFYREVPYFQVFAAKYGFVPNLSVLDLLFNEGPGAISFL